jgi:hypothetical protein
MIHTLSTAEEYQLVVEDVFDADETAADICINELCEEIGIANCPENEEEIMEAVIHYEDFLVTIYDHYRNGLEIVC